jgi:hypothetical protein
MGSGEPEFSVAFLFTASVDNADYQQKRQDHML